MGKFSKDEMMLMSDGLTAQADWRCKRSYQISG